MRINFIILLFACLCHRVTAQNLVPNPGFESFNKCPGSYNQGKDQFSLPGWYSPTSGTPDHFHACSIGEADIPYNWAGVSDPFEGNGYAGIFLWMCDRFYREYLQCELAEPLVKDSLYDIAFYYKLSSYSKYSVNRVGLLLTDSAVTAKHDAPLNLLPTLSIVHDSALTRKTGLWEKAALRYKAKGGERFVTIGNFAGNETKVYKIQFRPISEPMLASAAYYFIDQVEVIPAFWKGPEEVLSTVSSFAIENTDLDKTYILKNVNFAFNSYRLIPPSFFDLDQVAEFLLENPQIRVQLFGHTDDQGSEQYNLKLSRDRARNVGAYLSSIGIASSRIEYFGYGKSRPLVKGTSENARKQNRRVEIKFIR